jgi:hypothetical protein
MQPGAYRIAQPRRRRFLQHLLISSLQRAIPLAECDHPALAIAEDLHLDMSGIGDKALDVDARIAEACSCRALDSFERRPQALRIGAELHADPAAAGRALQHHGVSDATSSQQRILGGLQQPAARQQRNAAFLGKLARCVFQAKHRKMLRPRADEGYALCGQALGKA